MGKQINYYMGYQDFLTIAQKALECGCKILKAVDGKYVQGDSVDFVTEDEKRYYFYLSEAGELCAKILPNGHEMIGGYGASGNVVIEAGYSYINVGNKQITRARLFINTGYYDEQGQWVPRPDCLEKVYNRLMRVAKKLAPYTELVDTYISRREEDYLQEREYKHKEYISNECLLLREEQGYKLSL